MYPHDLPMPRTPLIGRERELTEAARRLLHDDVALLALTGPGGTGKTRLGLHLVAEVGQHFRDGTIFVPLAPIRDSDLVPSALARALGVQESTGRPVAEVVKDHLREKELLLFLDNFEQVAESGPYLTELLQTCRRLKILVTSRAVLRVSEESDYPVPPLELPTTELPTELPTDPLRTGASANDTAPLTARECQVAALVARGFTNRQIAEALVIAERTAENHVANICNKLSYSSRSQVAAWAAQHGLLGEEALSAGAVASAG